MKKAIQGGWNLKNPKSEAMHWRNGRVEAAKRFIKYWSLEFYVMTSPHTKTTLGKAMQRKLVTLDIWYKPTPHMEEKMEEYDDNMKEVIAEICRIVRVRQRTMTGLSFVHVMNEEVNLDEPQNHVLRRMMTIVAKEVTN